MSVSASELYFFPSPLLQSSITFHFLLDCVISLESMAEDSDEFYWDNFFVKVCGLPAPSESESIDHSYLVIDCLLGRRQALLCPTMRIRTIV